MARARDNQLSDRSREEIEYDAAMRLRVSTLKAMAKADFGVWLVNEWLELIPQIKNKRTKTQAIKGAESLFKTLMPQPTVQVDNRQVTVTAADLLRLASSNVDELPNKSTSEVPEELPSASVPVLADHSFGQAGVREDVDAVDALLADIQDEATGGHGRRLSTEAAEGPPVADEAKEDTTESLDDATRS